MSVRLADIQIIFADEAIRRGLLGELIDYSFHVERFTDFDQWPWLRDVAYPELWYNSLHYLGATRAWFGDPRRVSGSLLSDPSNSFPRPTRTLIVADYGRGRRGLIQASHGSLDPPDEWQAWFRIDGTEGQLRAQIGAMVGEPPGRPDRVDIAVRVGSDVRRASRKLPGTWFPDAFIGPMTSLMEAIADGGEPETSGADALRTLQLIEAIEPSHEAGRPVQMPGPDDT